MHLSAVLGSTLRAGAAVCALVCGAAVFAQAVAPSAAASTPAQPADLFDFWVGDWNLSWKNADGTIGKGRNRITKILDGAVIEEDFVADPASNPPPLLKGRSLSVQQNGVWRQAWADNQGGFFALTGQVEGDRRILMTDVVRSADKASAQRMVFHSISANALTWDWEGSVDGGATWKRLWRIEYRRRSGP